ncbi:MAG: pyrrolo-quinoline quinone [Oscillospiraceae bacterium]|nr:pyrrolo-quinoline quinone [Oscillospiraceae bacterium]
MYMPILAAGLTLAQSHQRMKPALILLFVIFGILAAGCVAFAFISARMRCSKNRRHTQKMILRLMCLTAAVVLVCAIACTVRYNVVGKQLMDAGNNTSPSTSQDTGSNESTDNGATQDSTQDTTPIPDPTFTPLYSDNSNPEKWGITWEIISNGTIVNNYKRDEAISFGKPEEYFALPGIATFRGNNFRNSAVYGTADVALRTLSKKWEKNNVGSLNGWPGCGWTGQPLIVKWDEKTKAIMNLFPEKKVKDDLVEVIYATLDGNIYFYDLDDGSFTRNPINVGMNFKGAGALDPRGYPLMYVGSGDSIGSKVPKMYVISLIDGKILYERSGSDAFSQRDWTAFDSSPLVDKETDTLIWPGENGILYTIKLNTVYDQAGGTISVTPEEVVKTRYSTDRSNKSTYWVGYEPSAVSVDRYLYISENGGMFFCIDLDTMSLVWAQDTRDDSNSTPVFEWNGLDGGYIYTAPSLHWTASGSKGYISIYKLDAKTGDIVWEQKFDCYTVSGVSGGVQSSPLLGKPGTELDGLIIYTVARTPNEWNGEMVAVDTQTGEIVWKKSMDNYTWSSPVAVYDKDGKAYIIVGDSLGIMKMYDSKGNELSTIELETNIEASPAVFNNTLVVGTRGGKVFGIEIK